jgi:hypothetical protein
MGVLQGFAPLGLIIGYMFTGMVTNYIQDLNIWRLGIFMQAFLMFPILFYLPTVN